jgi:hypothetical protein
MISSASHRATLSGAHDRRKNIVQLTQAGLHCPRED